MEKCKWLYSSEFYTTQCKMEFCFAGYNKKQIDKNYKFCPHCGREIKVVKQQSREGGK